MSIIENQVEDVKRFDHILKVMAEEGLGFLIDEVNLSHRLPLSKRMRRNRLPPPERLREAFEELGPTFIKFGQIMAQRPDVVPKEYADELEKLEDDVPAFDSSRAREIVDEEVGMDKFESFDDEPVAAASIAQVHHAVLRNGDEVAVKIRRPGIKEEIERDLDILAFLAKRAENHVDRFRKVRAHETVSQFASWTREELNLKREAKNADILRENLENEDNIRIPEMYSSMTTERVLVMEYVEGVKSNDAEALDEMNIDRERLAKTAIRSGLKQVIRDGFFHADPHPSNFLVDSDGNIIYLDFGMMGKLTTDMRRDLGLLIVHALNEEVDKCMEVVKRIGTVREDADLEGLKEEIEEKILVIRNTTLEEHSLTGQLLDITIKATRKGVVMPPSLVIMGKSLVTMEGIGLRVYPDFQITDEFESTVKQILKDDYDPKKIAEEFTVDLMENRDLLTQLPSKLNAMTESKEREIRIVNEQEPRDKPLAAGLVIAASILLLQAVPSDLALAIALLELIGAAWLLRG